MATTVNGRDFNYAACCGFPRDKRHMRPMGIASAWQDLMIPDSFDKFDEDLVRHLVADIRENGLIHYIGVGRMERPDGSSFKQLLWGRNRLEAWRRLREDELAENTRIEDPATHSHEYDMIPMVVFENPDAEFVREVRDRENMYRKIISEKEQQAYWVRTENERKAKAEAEKKGRTSRQNQNLAADRKRGRGVSTSTDAGNAHDPCALPAPAKLYPWTTEVHEALAKAEFPVAVGTLRNRQDRKTAIFAAAGVTWQDSGKFPIEDILKLRTAAIQLFEAEKKAEKEKAKKQLEEEAAAKLKKAADKAAAKTAADADKAAAKAAAAENQKPTPTVSTPAPTAEAPPPSLPPEPEPEVTPNMQAALDALAKITDDNERVIVYSRDLARLKAGSRRMLVSKLKKQ